MDPSLSFDLCIPRADVTFDDFRIRDAELLRQGFNMLQEGLNKRNTSFTDILSDAVMHTLFNSRR